MSKHAFLHNLSQEISRIDQAKITKRSERLIQGFSADLSPQAIINNKKYRIFNSNDYLGLRHHPVLKQADHEAVKRYGTGPGAVRFISGSLEIYQQLEDALAKFHNKEAGMLFSSAFAANLATLFSLLKPQSKDSLLESQVLVVSDELNHRSIIDGIRLANLSSDQKKIFSHMSADSLRQVLQSSLGKYQRVLVVSDGVFSMLGEYQDLPAISQVIGEFDQLYPQGVMLVVDDCHGVGAFGSTGRGTPEVCDNYDFDILVGTLGKGLGSDGGYVVADQVVIDYLRESAATYIYSNSISPGSAGAGLASLELIDKKEGKQLLAQLSDNVVFLKDRILELGFNFASDSIHPIQPILIGDTASTQALSSRLFDLGFLVTNINYPVVPKGRDEIRVQVCATHTKDDLEAFVQALQTIGKDLKIV